MTPPHPGTQ